jgi:hypothetical protein
MMIKRRNQKENKKIIPTNQQQQPQPQPLKQPNLKFGIGYMPSPDTNINTFNNNLIDMAMDKIKRFSTSLAPPLAPPQLPQQQPQAPPAPPPPQIIQQYIPVPSMSMPMPSMSMPMPNPSAPSYAPSLAPSMPPSMPPSNFATPAMTPVKAPPGKPPPPPPPPPPPLVGNLPTGPSISAAANLADAASALAALNPIINDVVKQFIEDPLIERNSGNRERGEKRIYKVL